jgi:hypothetical protein
VNAHGIHRPPAPEKVRKACGVSYLQWPLKFACMPWKIDPRRARQSLVNIA